MWFIDPIQPYSHSHSSLMSLELCWTIHAYNSSLTCFSLFEAFSIVGKWLLCPNFTLEFYFIVIYLIGWDRGFNMGVYSTFFLYPSYWVVYWILRSISQIVVCLPNSHFWACPIGVCFSKIYFSLPSYVLVWPSEWVEWLWVSLEGYIPSGNHCAT